MTTTTYQKRAMLLVIILIVITIGCLMWIILLCSTVPPDATSKETFADIYQNGKLLQSIPLSTIEESYIITIEGENGAVNEINVRPGSIGIISANCPDKLCVHQGYISNSLLPITCLPNRLVIQIRQANDASDYSEDEITPDIVTY